MELVSFENALSLFGSLIPVGFLMGFIVIIICLGVTGILTLFKKI